METIKLTTLPGWNPFLLDGRELHKINIYEGGEIIACFRWIGCNNIYKSITLDAPVKKARKVDLTRKDAFITLHERDKYITTYDLYLPARLVNLQIIGTEMRETWNYTYTDRIYTITLAGVRKELVRDELGRIVTKPVAGVFTEKIKTTINTEATPLLKKCEELAEKINPCIFSKISALEVRELLNRFNITEK